MIRRKTNIPDPRPARERQERDGHQRAHSLQTYDFETLWCTSTPKGTRGRRTSSGRTTGLHPAGSAARKPAQLNLFRDLDQYALKNLLVAGFNLSETGDVADHYRISGAKAKLIAEQFPQGQTFSRCWRRCALPEALKRT
ncbi:hypothetical protein [Klebsiella pneumoniae]|uniref:hypothetical protein n=1 Tax=Klebsiella pneumoniae TaxID=573 RepID=UPI0022B687B0|nr:hypothetical protein [Klebsiella pneumoniae]